MFYILYEVMKIRILVATLLSVAYTCVAIAQNSETSHSKTYFVSKPGTLVSLFTEEEANNITHLTLTGKLNAIDFRHLRDEFHKLKVLDISNASISVYSGKGGTYPERFYIYPSNCIPAYAFCQQINDSTFVGKNSLEKIVLSEKIKNIEDAAFKGCKNLKIMQLRKPSAPNLLSEAIADSITAIFVPLGSSDTYRTKVLWKTFAIIESDPIEASVQIGAMESLASELVKAGLQPKEVNFLTVEGKLDEADFALIRDYMPNLVSIDLRLCNATAIPEYTFTQKKYLLRVQLPDKLKSIGQRAFSGCTRLCGTLELPSSITAIEYGAFMGCTNLRYVVATGDQITTLGESLFGDENNKLIYKIGSKN